jgi:DNA-binding transcriptional LysR family regulator
VKEYAKITKDYFKKWNKQMPIDRLYLMSVFVAVAEQEGFAGAARRLNMSPPAVTRAIASLEEHLGIKLLNRTTRFVRVTEAGQRYLEDAKRVIAVADEADEAVAGINAEPRGHLVVTAPVQFGRMYVLPGVLEYLRRYPKTEVQLLLLDRVVNLLEEGVDVGIRIGELPDSSFKALAVGKVRHVICAAPSYLDAYGIPQTPEDLSKYQIIAASGVSSTAEWRFIKDDAVLQVRVKPRLTVTSNHAAIDAAVSGFGLTRLISYQIAPQLASGELKIVLAEYENKHMPIHVVHREGRHASVKVRAFIDLMAERLRANHSLK